LFGNIPENLKQAIVNYSVPLNKNVAKRICFNLLQKELNRIELAILNYELIYELNGHELLPKYIMFVQPLIITQIIKEDMIL
jgi:hypothetical protein